VEPKTDNFRGKAFSANLFSRGMTCKKIETKMSESDRQEIEMESFFLFRKKFSISFWSLKCCSHLNVNPSNIRFFLKTKKMYFFQNETA
jgi:hypothetical protein